MTPIFPPTFAEIVGYYFNFIKHNIHDINDYLNNDAPISYYYQLRRLLFKLLDNKL